MIKWNSDDHIKIANQQLIKQNNLTLVFNLINRLEPVSRVNLSKLTHLSPTTISSLVEELIKNDMVVEIGAGETTSSGRKPIMLKINQDSGFVISVELKSGKISGGAYDLKCNEILRKSVFCHDISRLGENLILFIESLMNEGELNKDNLSGITLGIPGIINYTDYTVASSTVIDQLHTNKTFYSMINDFYKEIPVIMENESCFAAYAEHTIARNNKDEDIILIDINEGVGCGIIIDDNIYKGAWGIAGELGHMVIDMHGEPCICGSRGCLETKVSVPSIVEKAVKAAREKGSGTFLSLMNQGDSPLFETLLKALQDNDPVATDTILYAADCLAVGINNIVNLLDIRQIIISGDVTKTGELFINRVKDKIKEIGFELYLNKIEVNYSTLGDDTVELGGARYMLDNIFEPKAGFAEQGK